MAQWTNSSGSWMRPYRNPWGAPQIKYYQESTAASSAVIKVGDLVRNNTVVTTGGQRVKRDPSTGGGGANLAHIGGAQLLGIAVEGSTSDGGVTGLVDDSSGGGVGAARSRLIGVAVADGLTEFLGYFKSGGAGATPIAASSLIGLNRAVVYDSTLARYFVDSTNSTAADAFVKITDFPSDALGDSGGVPVVFKFLSSNIHTAVAIGDVKV